MDPTALAELRTIMRGGRPTKPRRDEEFGLQRFVIDSLRLFGMPGIVFFAVPNGGPRSKRSAARMKASGVLPGVADIVILADGGPYSVPRPAAMFLELKSAAGRLSPAQKAFRDSVGALGFSYVVSDSPEDAINILLAWGVLKSDPLKRAGEGAGRV